MPAVQKAKSKGRKIGRNAVRCQQYRIEGRREKNKVARLRRYLARKAGEVARKARTRTKYTPERKGRIIKSDLQAERALKALI